LYGEKKTPAKQIAEQLAQVLRLNGRRQAGLSPCQFLKKAFTDQIGNVLDSCALQAAIQYV
jgi:hypothetical protein